MGFDPRRRWHRRGVSDYVYVVLGLVVCAGLVIWGIWG